MCFKFLLCVGMKVGHFGMEWMSAVLCLLSGEWWPGGGGGGSV